jgi:hypothetical protein
VSIDTPSSEAPSFQALSRPSFYQLTIVSDFKSGDSIERQTMIRNFPVVTGSRPKQTCDFPPEAVTLSVRNDGRQFAFGDEEPSNVGEHPVYYISTIEGRGKRELMVTGAKKGAEWFVKQDGSVFQDG